jgi:hypothetical protein
MSVGKSSGSSDPQILQAFVMVLFSVFFPYDRSKGSCAGCQSKVTQGKIWTGSKNMDGLNSPHRPKTGCGIVREESQKLLSKPGTLFRIKGYEKNAHRYRIVWLLC